MRSPNRSTGREGFFIPAPWLPQLRIQGILFAFFLLLPALAPAWSSSGIEGASFLDIPVGAGPAALGSAYSALAMDAYAPIWNPGGLGFLSSTQLAGQHLSYLESVNYEYAGLVLPLRKNHALGISAQYLNTGDISGTNLSAQPLGTFSSHYGAYSIAYGQRLTDRLALGLSAKLINAKISDVSANAYAMDAGTMLQASERVMIAAVLTNLGSKLTFLRDGDALPLAFHLGTAYQALQSLKILAEGTYRKNGLISEHLGMEWQPVSILVLRAGYKTDVQKDLPGLTGITTGVAINVWEQELAYAWVPYGDLGDTQYLSLVMRFGKTKQENKNVIDYSLHN